MLNRRRAASMGAEGDVVEKQDLVEGYNALFFIYYIQGPQGSVSHLGQVSEPLYSQSPVRHGDIWKDVFVNVRVVDDGMSALHLVLKLLEGSLTLRPTVILVDAQVGVVRADQVYQFQKSFSPRSSSQMSPFIIQADGDENLFVEPVGTTWFSPCCPAVRVGLDFQVSKAHWMPGASAAVHQAAMPIGIGVIHVCET